MAKEEDWHQHEDLPILVDLTYFQQKPIDSPVAAEEFKRFTLRYIERMEQHIGHLVRLLATQGIECQCDDQGVTPQCLIHVMDNLPED